MASFETYISTKMKIRAKAIAMAREDMTRASEILTTSLGEPGERINLASCTHRVFSVEV